MKDTTKKPSQKKHKKEKMNLKNNKENSQPNINHDISQSQEAKMDIEEIIQENLIGSQSTQDSKNSNLSNDSSKNNLNNINYAYSQIMPNSHPKVFLYEENPNTQKDKIDSDNT